MALHNLTQPVQRRQALTIAPTWHCLVDIVVVIGCRGGGVSVVYDEGFENS